MTIQNDLARGNLMTIEEVATYLQVSKHTLYQWRYLRKGPIAVRLGKHLRYRRSNVSAYLDRLQEEQSVETQPTVNN